MGSRSPTTPPPGISRATKSDGVVPASSRKSRLRCDWSAVAGSQAMSRPARRARARSGGGRARKRSSRAAAFGRHARSARRSAAAGSAGCSRARAASASTRTRPPARRTAAPRPTRPPGWHRRPRRTRPSRNASSRSKRSSQSAASRSRVGQLAARGAEQIAERHHSPGQLGQRHARAAW